MSENKQRTKTVRRNHHHGPNMIEKATDFKGTIKKIAAYMKKYWLALIAVMVFAAASAVFFVITPKKLGEATTEVYKGVMSMYQGGAGIDFDQIRQIILVVIILYLISSFFGLCQGLIMAEISMKMSRKMRKEASEKIHKLPMKYFDKVPHGEILSIISNDIDTFGQSLNQCVFQLVYSISTIIGIIYMMSTINIPMTLVALILVPLSGVVVAIIMSKSQKYFKQQQDYLGHVNGLIEEDFSGHNIIKAFNREEKSLENFMENNEKLYEAGWKAQFISGLMQPIVFFIGNLSYVAVSVLGGILVVKNKIEVGDIQAFIGYVRNLTQPINQITQVSVQLQSAVAAAERIFRFTESDEETLTEYISMPNEIKGDVEFRNVNFGYSEDNIVINNFNSQIKPGQQIAVVGPTGAGKTTIVKLLMRFYELNGGEILLDGVPVSEYKRQDYRKIFGMVLQDTWLFSGTIMENIRYGKPNATDEEVIAAAKSAHADKFIRTLPNGYNMVLTEDSGNISQGQKQLLTIARTMLSDCRIMILDEATSSVDTRTEQRIQRAMEKLMTGRTSFVIAHRLSTIKNSDIILVLKDGDIVEQGNHKELLKKDGFYAELYKSQFDR
ncbi:MAG: ABC transporter ATP-binding protein/permease [Ruminococcus sp.]|jgi:ATP-binding cassette subfamily B protein|nr:ABC transporter ATP-binding protein/permease [Ruminococcus sp.]